MPFVSFAISRSQPLPQITLMTFQPAPRKVAFQFLDDLAVAAHRAVEPLQVAVDDEDQIVEPFPRAAMRDRAQALRLVRLAIAEKGPHLAVRWCRRGRDHAGISGTAPDRSPSAGRGPSTRSGTARNPASATDADRTEMPLPSTSWRKFSICSSVSRPSRNARA